MYSIIATFKDELTGEMVERELGTMSEFWMYGDEYKANFCQTWADEKGNDQHNTWLTFISWAKKAIFTTEQKVAVIDYVIN